MERTMDMWGFDLRERLIVPGERFFFLRTEPPPYVRIGGAKGGKGADSKDEKVIPPHRNALSIKDAATAHLAEKGSQQEFVVSFQFQKTGTGADKDKVMPDPAKRWSYRGVFREMDGVAGVTCEEEGAQVRSFVSSLADSSELLKGDESPAVWFYKGDGDRDGKLKGDPDVGSVDFKGLDSLPKTAKGEDKDSPPSSISDFIKRPDALNKAKLDAERANIDQLIEMLLAALAVGDLDVLAFLFDTLALRSGLSIAEVAGRTAKALGATDEEAAELGKKIEEGYRKSDDPKKRGDMNASLQKLQLLMSQNKDRKEQLGNILRTLMGVNDAVKNIANNVHDWSDRQGRSHSGRWGV